MNASARPRDLGTVRLCVWACRYALREWPGLIAVLGTALVQIGLDVLRPWPMKLLIDGVLQEKPVTGLFERAVAALPGSADRQALLVWAVMGTVVIFLLSWALGLASAYAAIGLGQRMTYDLAADLFGHLQRLSLRFHGRRPVGDSIRRVTADCGCASTIIQGALLPVLTTVVTLVTMFAVMWRIDRVLTLYALAVLPPMVLTQRRYAQPIAERSYRQHEAEGRIYSVIEQTLSALPVVKAFGREDEGDLRFRAGTDTVLHSTLGATAVQLKFKILLGLATAVGTAGIIWLGARHALRGTLTVGSILVFLSYLGSLYGPLHTLLYSSSTIQGAAGNARRVLEVLGTEPEVRERPDARPLSPARGHVRLEGVTFGYEPGRPVLRDVGLAVRPGETLALVGATGAGKSTLVGLVPRFFDPWQGRVLVDGRDVRDVTLRSLRAQVALVLQEPFLLPLTVAENIAYGRPDATQAEIEAVARAARAHDFIERLPQGYDTVIGERGATLSGGERQRIAIARALLKDAPILILDEPTSALDAQTERLLLEALERLTAGRTTLVIAHRLSTIRRADRIAVLDAGRIVEQGTHGELLARGGAYARLYRAQMPVGALALSGAGR